MSTYVHISLVIPLVPHNSHTCPSLFPVLGCPSLWYQGFPIVYHSFPTSFLLLSHSLPKFFLCSSHSFPTFGDSLWQKNIYVHYMLKTGGNAALFLNLIFCYQTPLLWLWFSNVWYVFHSQYISPQGLNIGCVLLIMILLFHSPLQLAVLQYSMRCFVFIAHAYHHKQWTWMGSWSIQAVSMASGSNRGGA